MEEKAVRAKPGIIGPGDQPIVIGSNDNFRDEGDAGKPDPGGVYIRGKSNDYPPAQSDGNGGYFFELPNFTAAFIKDKDDNGNEQDIGSGWRIVIVLSNENSVTISASAASDGKGDRIEITPYVDNDIRLNNGSLQLNRAPDIVYFYPPQAPQDSRS